MNKKDLRIVKEALKILENEFYEPEDETSELKPFLFTGSEKQAISFYDTLKKNGIKAKMEAVPNPFGINYYVETNPLNKKDYKFIDDLSARINKTVK